MKKDQVAKGLNRNPLPDKFWETPTVEGKVPKNVPQNRNGLGCPIPESISELQHN